MSGLVVDAEKCVGCGRCVRTCANDGIEVVERRARVLDGCVSCGMCKTRPRLLREAAVGNIAQWGKP